MNLLVEASQVKESDYVEDISPKNAETPEEKKEDDGIELDSSDSGEFYSIPNTPSLGTNANHVDGQFN